MIVIGVDEVGRGCWAGPLAAAAVAFNVDQSPVAGLNDSKKLSRQRRDTLAPLIRAAALGVGIGWVAPESIDTHGITAAVQIAMEAAVLEVLSLLPNNVTVEVIVDGSYNFLKEFVPPGWQGKLTISTMVGADGLVPAVSAASIIAKVARDDLMAGEVHASYPAYGFDSHVGYGTAAHIKALSEFGVTAIHRQSYKPIQKLLIAKGGVVQSAS